MTLSLEKIDQDYLIAARVAENLREHDLKEMELLYPGQDVYNLLFDSVDESVEVWEITTEGGKTIAIGGVAEVYGLPGYCVWLVGTSEMDELRRQREMLRLGKDLMPRLLRRYQRLSNYCSADKGQIWAMRQLGFTVHETENKDVRFIECVQYQ